ncbi:putative ABC multidrug transporter [Karstenula rhodostoma CBS 690.94]|uniref:ABC multidrug transporter n=1 Tax=Karstenula rhodostoma CBS 690.94 TaxID=1392251 RepID=A0A9P4P875_9PLEO|nr:putative ABC multidrug transporter [Karstenula rhodostoma CBS 690.94]
MPFSNGEAHLFQFNEDGFDFNVQFEQIFFSVLPSVLFIITSLWRTFHQSRKPAVVHAPAFQLLKAIAIATYLGLELALLVLVATGSFHTTGVFIAASVLKLVSALLMVVLSIIDHSRSPRPSVLLSIYLSVTLLLDVAQARTLFLSADGNPEVIYSSLFCATIALKALMLLLEAKQKTPWVHWNEKEHSPEETSGVFSIGVFFWLNKMFLLGYRKVLNVDDLYPLDRALDSKALHDKFSNEIDYSKLKGDKYGLVKALTRTLAGPLLIPIIPRLALLGFTICQPLFMEKLLDYLSQPTLEPNIGYGFIGATFFIYSGMEVSRAFYWYYCDRLRTMTRSVLVTEIYLQATNARIGVNDDSAALTLMSTDMERIRYGMRSLHEVWASLIQAALAAWMLYNRIGVGFVAPISIIIACFIGLAILTNYTGDSQREWMAAVQERVGLTATVISSMKNLKISSLSAAIGSTVQRLRVDELRASVKFRKIFITSAFLGFFAMLIGPPVTFALLKNTLDVSTMFTSLAFLTLLTYPLAYIFEGIPHLVTTLACLGRIQAFLECETRDDFRKVFGDTRQETEKPSAGTPGSSKCAITIADGNFGWRAGEFVLRNVHAEIPKAALTMVVGPVGSGKSTFCKALLGEIPFASGSVSHTRTSHIGFCEQAAFLSNGSIRDNIVGFSTFDQKRYSEVIDATSLAFDIATFPNGDRTNIGSDGMTLSGGQKQRLSLARALYLQSDLLVLDDVFSGLDADTEARVFRQVFAPGGLIRRRAATVVLCTHSVKHLPDADHVIVLGNDTIAEQGSYADLITGSGYVRGLDLDSSSNSDLSVDAFDSSSSTDTQTTPPMSLIVIDDVQKPDNDMSRQVGDKTVYKHYINSMGLHVAGFALLFAASWGFFTNFPTIWLTYWTNDVHSEHTKHNNGYYAGIYGLLQVCALLSLLSLAVTLWVFGIKRAGANLHEEALRTLIRAPLRFFTKTDTGVITNLFSQDLNLIDTELPDASLNVLIFTFESLGQMAVMLTSSLYLGIAYPFLGAILFIVGRFYLRTSRQLRLLDLETKSPLYTHFLDTVKGVTTLRAYGFMSNEIAKNIQLINTSQRPAYLLQMVQEWLSLVLGLVVMVLAVILVVLSIQFHAQSAFAGASLYSLITLGENLAGIVLYYTRLETSIGAIARLKTFNESVKPEDRDEHEDVIPAEQWPRTGAIEIAGVSAAYDADEEHPSLALRDISLKIESGEKVAICGRTGSGKSSLVALLLKLLDPLGSEPQQVLIDDVPLYRINRAALRQRIIAVPQEAVFLPDGTTFQSNLDPYDASTPEECTSVLVAVGLWAFVEERGGLNAGMTANTFSAGQRQLFSVGRALLRRRIRASSLDGATDQGILLLDEVSSSVDRETEIIMQEIIKSEFTRYTVIAVSHRLDMIMDFDRVIVMDKGAVVETGKPIELAAKEESRFGDLIRAGNRKRNERT